MDIPSQTHYYKYMAKEGSPVTPQPIINKDGSLNSEALAKRFGITEREANQEVKFGARSGTVADMLNDARCPVGGIISSAFQEGGLEGVERQFGLLKQMDPGFEVIITPETKAEIGEGKKKLNPPSPSMM